MVRLTEKRPGGLDGAAQLLCDVDPTLGRLHSSSVQQAEQRLAKVAEESGSYPVSRDLATLTEEGHR